MEGYFFGRGGSALFFVFCLFFGIAEFLNPKNMWPRKTKKTVDFFVVFGVFFFWKVSDLSTRFLGDLEILVVKLLGGFIRFSLKQSPPAWHLKMEGWKTISFPFGGKFGLFFRGFLLLVSGRLSNKTPHFFE